MPELFPFKISKKVRDNKNIFFKFDFTNFSMVIAKTAQWSDVSM